VIFSGSDSVPISKKEESENKNRDRVGPKLLYGNIIL
jgi:hypothetical protein